MKKHKVKLLLLCLFAGVFSLVGFLGCTQMGLKVITGTLDRLLGEQFSIENVQGTLINSWSAEGITYTSPDLLVSLEKVSILVQANACLKGKLHLRSILGEKLHLTSRKGTSRKTDKEHIGEGVSFPLAFILDQLKVQDITLVLEETQNTYTLGSISLQAQVFGDFSNPTFSAKFHGKKMRLSEETVIDAFKANFEAQINTQGESVADLEFSELQYGGKMYRDNGIHFEGSLNKHRIAGNFGPEIGELAFFFMGGVQQGGWQGTVEEFTFRFPEKNIWKLKESSRVSVLAGGVFLQPFCLLHEEEEVCLQGDWKSQQSWDGRASLSAMNLGSYIPSWEGELSGEFHGMSRMHGEVLNHHFQANALSGTLAGEPIEGKGKMVLGPDGLLIDELQLQLAGSSFSLAGSIGDELKLSLDAQSVDIGQVLPQSQGKIHVQGTVSGTRELPQIKLTFNAAKASFQNIGAEKLTGNIVGDMKKGGIIEADVQGVNIGAESWNINQSKLHLSGTVDTHQFQLEILSSVGDVRLNGTGQLLENTWQTRLTDLDILSSMYGDWQLGAIAEMFIGHERVETKDFCLQGTSGKFCLQGLWNRNSFWNVQADMPFLSLELLKNTGFLLYPVTGGLQASLEAEGRGASPQKIYTEIALQGVEASVFTDDGKKQVAHTLEGTLKTKLENQLLSSSIRIESDMGATVWGDIELEGVGEPARKIESLSVHGQLSVNIQDIASLSGLVRYPVDSSGRLQGTFDLGGFIGKPQLKGELSLLEGNVSLPSLGLDLDNLNISIDAHKNTLGIILGSSTKEGHLEGKGSLTFEGVGDWIFTGGLQGENFACVNLPEYEIFTTPNLSFDFNENDGRVAGKIVIPRARLRPIMKDKGASVSDDVVFIDVAQTETGKKWDLSTDILLELGDDVQLDSHGLQGKLEGKLTIQKVPGRVFMGSGDVAFADGTFILSRRTFDIERGRLLFTGGPIDNPGMDIRAHNTIGDILVGVDIGGSFSDMKVQLFSTPYMEESDIISYLVLGRSMSGGSSTEEGRKLESAAASLGVAGANFVTDKVGKSVGLDEIYLEGGGDTEDMSVLVGKNIGKDLYLGYEHNFFDSVGEFRVRYKLGRGFSVETRTSVNSTSGDILYTIER